MKPDIVRTTPLERNVTENNEVQNAFENTPAVEPEPSEVHAAVVEELAKENPDMVRIEMAPCACGQPMEKLTLDTSGNNKVGRVVCGQCGIWGVEFLIPRTDQQEVVGKAATKAWNEAPRPV